MKITKMLAEFWKNFVLVLKRNYKQNSARILPMAEFWQNFIWTLAEFWQNFVLVLKRNYK